MHYRYVCTTENAYVYESRATADGPPTACVNEGSSIVSESITVLREDAATLSVAINDSGTSNVDVWSAAQIQSALAASVASVASASLKTWIIRDEKADGTDGGSLSANTWHVRDLNTVAHSDGSEVTLANNEFTLAAGGSYRIRTRAPASGVDQAQARLYNVTDASVVSYGSTSSTVNANQSDSSVSARVDIAASDGNKTFRIEHRSVRMRNGTGLGRAAGVGGVEVYTSVIIDRLGDYTV